MGIGGDGGSVTRAIGSARTAWVAGVPAAVEACPA